MTNVVINPENPSIGDQRTIGGTRQEWDGSKWKNVSFGNHEVRISNNFRATEALLKSLGLSGNFGFFNKGFTYTEVGDVGIDDNNQFWIYNGSLPFEVVKGTVPSEPDYSVFDHTTAVGAHDDIYDRKINDLSEISGILKVDGNKCSVNMYHQNTPVLNSRYIYKSDVSKSNHDGGYYIDPDASFPVDWSDSSQRESWYNSSNSGFGVWVLLSQSPTPEHYGAGNSDSDDSLAVLNWWAGSHTASVTAGNEYNTTIESTILRTVTERGFRANLEGANFTNNAETGILLAVDVVATGKQVIRVNGANIDCSDKAAVGLSITSSNDSTVRKIDINNIGVYNVKGLSTKYSSSPTSLSVSLKASVININSPVIDGVDRDYSNAGLVASRAIAVLNTVGSLTINEPVISNVTSPELSDADGITVFSVGKDFASRQQVSININNPIMTDISGRFIKAQSTNVVVNQPRFYSLSGAIQAEFCAIDFQYGGGTVNAGSWYLDQAVTGGVGSRVINTTTRDVGNYETVTRITGMEINLGRNIRYFTQSNILNGELNIELLNNKVISKTPTGIISTAFSRIECQDSSDMSALSVKIKDNSYSCDDNTVLQLVGDDFSGVPSIADKISLQLTDNYNYKLPSTIRQGIIIVAATDQVPYLNNIVIRGNNCAGSDRNAGNWVRIKDLDLNKLPVGNSFYYISGGLINSPSVNYSTDLLIESIGQHQRVARAASNTFAQRALSLPWYEYTGSPI